jgi:hypothetical protein
LGEGSSECWQLVAYLSGESDPDSNTVGYSKCYAHSNAYCDTESNVKRNSNGDTKSYSHTQASSDAASETVMPG